ncbi:MAG: LUD domain-containing protein [Chitinophagaceae bacterium]
MSRDKILAAVKVSQPELQALPTIEDIPAIQFPDPVAQYKATLQVIGGYIADVKSIEEVGAVLQNLFPQAKRIVSAVPGVASLSAQDWQQQDPHALENVEVGVISSSLAVAENGAIWVTEKDVQQVRVLPFIVEHLVAIISAKDIVSNMQQAYQKIDSAPGFNVFIAGPSKTADIEQSLVLGAHGPKSMTVVVIG